MGKTLNRYINRLFTTEEAGKEWAERKARLPDMRGYDLNMGWRKIKYAPEEPELFSVSFIKEDKYNA
jgi:hypothetical protein